MPPRSLLAGPGLPSRGDSAQPNRCVTWQGPGSKEEADVHRCLSKHLGTSRCSVPLVMQVRSWPGPCRSKTRLAEAGCREFGEMGIMHMIFTGHRGTAMVTHSQSCTDGSREPLLQAVLTSCAGKAWGQDTSGGGRSYREARASHRRPRGGVLTAGPGALL